MQQLNTTMPSPKSSSFAALLAALAAPSQRPEDSFEGVPQPAKKPAPAWNDDDLADDVATLSYERALRAHARYRSPAVADQAFAQPAEPEHVPYEPVERKEDISAFFASAQQPAPRPIADAGRQTEQLRAAALERNLKDASITIRMSKAECAQLHRRAAEAGLTVSAYLRSCTFEAESLRAEVKKALTEIKSGANHLQPTSHAPVLDPEPPRRSWFGRMTGWLARLLTPWNGSQRVVRA